MKKISIIVPVYRVEKYLDRCIESLVNQKYKNIEIILVDDGSPDNCPKMCDEWAKKDSRIKVIHKENGGLSDARNYGLNIATGDYIGFVDSDDFVSVEMYKTLIELLESNDADISICQYAKFSKGSIPAFTNEEKIHIFRDSNETLNHLFCGNIPVVNAVWNKLYKKELFDGIRFPVGLIFEDRFITHKIILKSRKSVVIMSKLYGYLVNREESIMGNWNYLKIKNLILASNTRYSELKENKKILNALNSSRGKDIYNSHALVTIMKNEEIYNSPEMISEHEKLKKVINIGSLFGYLEGGDIKIKVLKIILVLNRKVFWKIRTRRKKNNEI